MELAINPREFSGFANTTNQELTNRELGVMFCTASDIANPSAEARQNGNRCKFVQGQRAQPSGGWEFAKMEFVELPRRAGPSIEFADNMERQCYSSSGERICLCHQTTMRCWFLPETVARF